MPLGGEDQWRGRIRAATTAAASSIVAVAAAGIALAFLADAPPGPPLPRGMSRSDEALGVGSAFASVLAALFVLVLAAHRLLVSTAWPAAAEGTESAVAAVGPRPAEGLPVGPGVRRASRSSGTGSPGRVPTWMQRGFLGALLVSQAIAACLLSEFAAGMGLTRNTITTTQLFTEGFVAWISLLQRADAGLLVASIIWVHHIALVVAADSRWPADAEPAHDIMFFAGLLLWSAAIWEAQRERDREADDDHGLQLEAALRAQACQELVHELLPPPVEAAVRSRLQAGLSPSVAFYFPLAILIQSDIVVRDLSIRGIQRASIRIL